MPTKYTNCVDCGTVIEYAKKKPKWCRTCKTKQPIQYRKPKTLPARSKLENTVRKLLNKIFPEAEYIDSGYYSWILSPKDYPLQLDRYYPELKLAFEVQGKQHQEYTSFVHETEDKFQYLRECDAIKVRSCKRRGINLVHIHHDMPLGTKSIIALLEESGAWERVKRITMIGRV